MKSLALSVLALASLGSVALADPVLLTDEQMSSIVGTFDFHANIKDKNEGNVVLEYPYPTGTTWRLPGGSKTKLTGDGSPDNPLSVTSRTTHNGNTHVIAKP